MLDETPPPQTALRPPCEVMRLRRMGASFPTRLSFLRSLMRRLSDENVQITRRVWEMCDNGFGHAVYSLSFGGHTYSLVAVSTDLPPEMRTDRVIATAWDTAYVLYDGTPDKGEIERIIANAPLQEAGRFSERDLVLSRANKSVRLWAHVVDALRAGRQPDTDLIRDTGYLMRTTAVYGNGKFGIADRALIADRDGLQGPFAAEMLTVWMIRHFTHDLVEHVGRAPLDRHLKRHLGIGNSTGLGMAPFLVSHPVLLNNWVMVRETALARVRAINALTLTQIEQLYSLAARAAQHLAEWSVPDDIAMERINTMRSEWPQICDLMTPDAMTRDRPLDTLMNACTRFSPDAQELLAALLMEPFGDLIDGLTDCMADPFGPPRVQPMAISDLQEMIQSDWQWALEINYDTPRNCAQFWYVSEEKLEPRLGNRHNEDGAELESPLDVARRVKSLAAALSHTDHTRLTTFLASHPEHRFAASRVQTCAAHPYSEIRDNLICETCLPIDMLRCKLAFFGAAKFDPKSDRWTRITLCQGAPLADELADPDDWWLPTFSQ